MRTIITFAFLFINLVFLYGVQYSGTVYLACSDTPLEGVTVQVRGSVGAMFLTYQTTTDVNGDYSFNVSGTDSFWNIKVISPMGVTDPTSYIYFPSQGNQSSVDFDLLVQPEVFYGPQSNNVVLDPDNAPFDIDFSPQEYCANSGNCINISEPFASTYYWGTTEEVCFSAKVFGLDRFGNRVSLLGSPSCLRIGGRPSVGLSEGCERYHFDIDPFVQGVVGDLVELEITQGCCNKKEVGCIQNRGLTNTWSHYLYINGISNASVDFQFGVPFDVDSNNGTDPPNDGSEAIALTPNGPALGKITTSILPVISSSEPLDEITYNIYEVECSTGFNEALVLSNTESLNGLTQPAAYSFANFEDANGDEYFLDDNNHLGKCFKVECVAANNCGEVSAYSYFTIDPNENFQGGGGTGQFVPVGTNGPNGAWVYPNPVHSELYVNISGLQPGLSAEVLDVNGRAITSLQLNDVQTRLDVSDLPGGVYLIRVNHPQIKPLRFVKH